MAPLKFGKKAISSAAHSVGESLVVAPLALSGKNSGRRSCLKSAGTNGVAKKVHFFDDSRQANWEGWQVHLAIPILVDEPPNYRARLADVDLIQPEYGWVRGKMVYDGQYVEYPIKGKVYEARSTPPEVDCEIVRAVNRKASERARKKNDFQELWAAALKEDDLEFFGVTS